MLFSVNPAEGLPIYDQIVRQVKYAVAGSSLQAGDLVPSVRELARELAVNPNTVARAYRDLQQDGVLRSVRGLGLAVAPRAAAACRQQRLQLIRARLREALAEAVASQLQVEEVRQLVLEELDALTGSAAGKPAKRSRKSSV